MHRYLGYSSFRPLQEDIITSVLDGRDTLAILPTGGGKSLCFQVPSMAREGICLVVSPLVALMKDQVGRLREKNIRAAYIVSGMLPREIDHTLNNCIFGDYKFLYVSPERLQNDMFLTRFKDMPVNCIAVDEAHCVSQWGYDFRPSYLQIPELREFHPNVPVLALTATATPQVAHDIVDKLALKAPASFKASLLRENLSLSLRREADKIPKLIEIADNINGSGIVYTMSRRKTKAVAEALISQGHNATYYHAGLGHKERQLRQNQWTSGQKRIIVATNAFGMGIDKSDVRFVVHFDVPESLEAYYQEAGRAGRDGQNAFAILLSNQKDEERLQNSAEISFPDKQVLRAVLIGLFNHLQVAFGEGTSRPYRFNLRAFSKFYDLEPILAHNAIGSLKRDGWLELSDAFYSPSKLLFKVKNKDLYKFLVKQPQYEELTKYILRNYGGLFEQYVTIDEAQIARRLNFPPEKVVTQLEELHRLQMAAYYGQNELPTISFLRERPLGDRIVFDEESLNFLRDRHQLRIDEVLQYIEGQRVDCRFSTIMNYFGEVPAQDCGVCDSCKRNAFNSDKEATLLRIQQDILSALKVESLADQALRKHLQKYPAEFIEEMMRYLIQEEKIRLDGLTWRLR
ncbi:MAG: RecQ family ATP-dependent DNA helicase [Saprospiraceae bacterium]|nr:RecQ family ATP-dependent DNA helicase [Saprospiraceae bacterium]